MRVRKLHLKAAAAGSRRKAGQMAKRKQTARIEQWARFGDGLIGRVLSHPRQSEFTAPQQVTSSLVKFDEAKGIAETFNTRYTLGNKVGCRG